MDTTTSPLTAAARGVFVWMACGVAAIAVFSSIGVMRPAFPNEGALAAFAFLAGGFVAGWAVWKKEPASAALTWAFVDTACALVVLAWPVPLGLS